jgi:hypothetical protein
MGEKRELEKRTYNFEIRATEEEETGIITGRPIVYNSVTDLGWFDEVIDEGALDGADLTDVRFLVNHNTSMIPLARSRRNNGNSTMQMTIDQGGLLLDWVKLDIKKNATASELFSAIQRQDVTGMSFMFSVDEELWENVESEHPTRHIRKIGSVVEVSAVTFPAYDATSINARSEEALESARQSLEKEREQRAKELESLELLKLKINLNRRKSK